MLSNLTSFLKFACWRRIRYDKRALQTDPAVSEKILIIVFFSITKNNNVDELA